MKCFFCGGESFAAHERVYLDIIVDGMGMFERNFLESVEESIYEHESPYGPFECQLCGAVYESLNEMAGNILSGLPPIDWNQPITPSNLKTQDNLVLVHPQFAQELFKRNVEVFTVYPDGQVLPVTDIGKAIHSPFSDSLVVQREVWPHMQEIFTRGGEHSHE